MIWDIGLAVCCIGITLVAIIATFLDHKPHKFLCGGTVIFLAGFTVIYFNIGYPIGDWSELVCTLAWLVLLFQRRR